MKCKNCGSGDDLIQMRTRKHSMTKLYCKKCENYTSDFSAPKILLLDIETSKAIFAIYHTGNQYIRHDQLIADNYITGWAAKWLFDNKMYSCFVTPAEAKKRNEKRVVIELYKMMCEANMVVTHNGDKFDIKELQARFVKYGLQPNNRYISVDTLKKAKQVLRVQSYSLAFLLNYFGLSPKLKRGDTDAAEAGDRAALIEDEKYCRQDVYGLEDLYLKLRGWMRTHPNMSIFYEMHHPLAKDEKYCPRCLRVVGDAKWHKQYRTPSGVVYESCNCPNPKCRAVLRREKL